MHSLLPTLEMLELRANCNITLALRVPDARFLQHHLSSLEPSPHHCYPLSSWVINCSFNFIGFVIENICKYKTWKREIQHEARQLQSAYSNYILKFTEVWGLVNFGGLFWGVVYCYCFNVA